MTNQIRTALLLGALTGVIILAGGLIGGRVGIIIALVLAAGMNFFSYWYSDKIILKMYRARPITPDEAPDLHRLVESLCRRAGLPMPKVFIMPEEAPNAFATGRNPDNAVVAVTQGLIRYMNEQELAGVIAHELGHVKNRDILIGSIAATLAGAIMVLASFARWAAIFGGVGRDDDDGGGIIGLIAMSILAPVAAMMIQMAISRSREYLADSTSADITGNPDGLASALEKLGAYSKKIPFKAEPATAHMFITNPLAGKNLMNLFSTHPPIERRIARLRG
ncbi:MAG: zinc metalloprotease HtpX [Thermodesulfobacteriota bacterium]|nr:zinc metalloprotease HtpX [Thermodesulfobacteriota bacterium]